MGSHSSVTRDRSEALGLALGALGVLIFSFTLPATKAAVAVFGAWVVGIGRAVVAGVLAAAVLKARGAHLPNRAVRRSLAIVAAGVVVGFPLFTALALEYVPATRGAIVVGVLPAATALAATLRHGERPSIQFWIAATGGLATVVIFAIVTGANGRPEPADALLLLAVAAAAIGYAEGASVSAQIGGWQTISWALVFSLPVTVVVTVTALFINGVGEPTAKGLIGMAYVSVFSMFLGFFAWYAGLTIGGVARVSQIQLLQPVLTLLWASLFLGEEVTLAAGLAAVAVLGFVVATRRAPIRAPVPAK